MASINISEQDFETVAWAAREAQDRGDAEEAQKLDKIARKINLALSANCLTPAARFAVGGPPPKRTWKDMPSTLDPLNG